jgi:signal transduction histidine kinase
VEIPTNVQTMSHDPLRETGVLGLIDAIKAFCKEFGEQQKIETKFKSHDLPRNLSPEISLFRVIQESLPQRSQAQQNKHVDVKVGGMSDEIHLTVSDPGCRF